FAALPSAAGLVCWAQAARPAASATASAALISLRTPSVGNIDTPGALTHPSTAAAAISAAAGPVTSGNAVAGATAATLSSRNAAGHSGVLSASPALSPAATTISSPPACVAACRNGSQSA